LPRIHADDADKNKKVLTGMKGMKGIFGDRFIPCISFIPVKLIFIKSAAKYSGKTEERG